MIHIEEPETKEELDRQKKEWQAKKKIEAAERRKRNSKKNKEKKEGKQ